MRPVKQKQLDGMRAFYIIFVGVFVSRFGSFMTMFGISVWAYQQTGSATTYSTLTFFALMPAAIGSIISGPYVDRWNRRQVLIWSDLIASLSTIGIMLLFWADALAQWHLYIALTINGFANAFFGPAFQASIPLLVPKDQLARVAGVQSFGGLVPIISAAVAGFIISQFGLGTIFLIDFATLFIAIGTILIVSIPQPPSSDSEKQSFVDNFKFGLNYVCSRKPFLYLISFITAVTFLNGILAALLGPLVLSFDNPQSFGWVYASFGAGGVLCGILLTAWGGPTKRMPVIFINTFAASIGAIIAGIVAHVAPVMIGIFIYGLNYSMLRALSKVIYQTKAAPEVLGRIFALITVTTLGIQAISTISAGPLAEQIFEPLLVEGGNLTSSVGQLIGIGAGRGIGLMYIIVGVILFLLAAVGFFNPKLRDLEDNLPDATIDSTI